MTSSGPANPPNSAEATWRKPSRFTAAARCTALSEQGQRALLAREAGDLCRELQSGRWQISPGAWFFLLEEAQNWLPAGSVCAQAPDSALAASAAADMLWQRTDYAADPWTETQTIAMFNSILGRLDSVTILPAARRAGRVPWPGYHHPAPENAPFAPRTPTTAIAVASLHP